MWEWIYPHMVLLIFANIIFKVSCKGNGSLAFVIDETQSMRRDIDQVIRSVDHITDIVRHEKSSLIDEMVLVTFNDPGVYDRVVTRESEEFKKALKRIDPHNERSKRSDLDCWEPSMKGLRQALHKSNNDSYIFVFTDAPAKDYIDSHFVIEMCQQKQTQIVFVITGKFCHKFPYVPEARNCYFDIAAACSGLTIFVKKEEVEKVFGPIEEIIKGNKTVITTTTVPAGVSQNIPFTIDDYTDYVIVSASGLYVTLKINGPSVSVKEIMSTDNAKVLKLSNTKPGNYVATVKGKTNTSVIILGRTDFFFTHGFSELEPKSLRDTLPQPKSDSKGYLAIFVTDDNHSVRIETAKILDMDGKPIIEKLPLREKSQDFYVTDPFVAPSQRFRVAVEGIVKASNKPIRRTAKIPVTPPPPNIVPKIEGVTALKVIKGETAVFECKVVNGSPVPKMTWLFWDASGSKFTLLPGSESVLRITSVEDKHRGKYKCVAENSAGKDEHITTLFVQALPKIISRDSIIYESTEGDASLKIPCLASGLPKPSITWKLKGLVISPSAKYSIEDGTLIISNPMVSDTNSYTCEATNDVGVVSASFRTDIRQAPQVSGDTDKKVRIGTSASIKCKVVKGKPKPTVSWQFMDNSDSNSPILGSDEVLHIPRVENKHAGRYKCIAKNKVGSSEHITTLVVQEAPQVSGDTDKKVRIGTSASIECKVVKGKPRPTISWQFMDNTDSDFSILGSDEVLHISRVENKHAGRYKCIAMNEAGSSEHITTLVVQVAPQVGGVATKNVRIGLPTSIECTVKGEPKPTIRWQFMDNSSSRILTLPGYDKVLHISKVEKKHTGRYKCVAKNVVGSDEHVTTLIVESLPRITTTLTKVEGIEGDLALRIPCDVVGVPQPVVTWKINGTKLTPDDKYSIEDGALVIMKPEKKDSSSYTCEAKNSVGSFSTTFQAAVKEHPKTFGTKHFVYVLEGETRKLKCEAYSSKSQSVKWFGAEASPRYPDSSLNTTSSQDLETTTASNNDYYSSTTPPAITLKADIKEPYLQIKNASYSDDGIYMCRVTDKHGNTHTQTYVVDVGNAPKFHSEDSDAKFLSNWGGDISHIQQNCDIQENAHPNPVVEWTFNGQVLSDFNSAGVGHYTCNVSNVHGSIQKIFNVTSSVCLITRNLRDAHYMPLILSDNGFWHTLDTTNNFIVIKRRKKITLSCPSHMETSNTFKNFPKKSTLEAGCNKEDSFVVEDKIYKLSDLQCTNSFRPSVIRKKVKCSKEPSELIRVGYNVSGFLEAYEVCFGTEQNMPLYTRTIMTEIGNEGMSAGYNWHTYPGIGTNKTERGFTCKDTMSSCCYSKSQLVNAIDFNDGPAMQSTFIDPLNVVPIWLPCNTSKPTWETVNDKVTSLLPSYNEVITWSGTQTFQEKNGVIIPRYLWKLVWYDDKEVVAIVHVNDPSPTEKDIKCKDTRTQTEYTEWIYFNDKFTYCCSQSEFLEAFNIHIDIGEFLEPALDEIKNKI